ncbi:MAG: ABC transporter permease [Actinobacteria bacterium]|nr:MAG: ABC transporter permease [Actinomycetota bacterium]
MLAVRWKKVLRDLVSHRFRTVLVVLSIATGIFAVGVVMGGRAILLREFDSEFAASVPLNADFYTMPFSDPIVRRAREYPGVAAAMGRHATSLRYRWSGSDAPRTLSLVAIEDFRDVTVQRIVPENVKSWPPKRGEIVLERAALQVGAYEIGDTLQVETRTGEKKSLIVSGFVHDINAVPAQFVGSETGYVSFESLPDIGEAKSYNELLVAMTGTGLTQREASLLAENIKRDVLEENGITVLGVYVPRPGSHFLGDIFKAVSLLLLALGLLSLLLSGFLVVNTVSALMAQQIKQVGIMKAIGGRASQITWMYLGMVAVYGILAVLVGVPASAWAGQQFIEFAAGVLNFRVSSYVPPDWVTALEVGVGLIVPLLAAIIPIRLGTRTSVVRALTQTGVDSSAFGHGLVDRVLGLLRGLPRPVALSLRNTFLRKGRLLLTLTTLSLASAVVMSVFSVQASINQTTDDLDEWWRYEAQVRYEQQTDQAGTERIISSTPGVTGVESWVGTTVTLDRPDGTTAEGLNLIGAPYDTTFIHPTMLAGRWLQKGDDDAIVVNTDARKSESSLDLGQRVTVEVAGEKRVLKVVGVVKGQFGGSALYMNRDALAVLLPESGITQTLIRMSSTDTAAQRRALDDIETRLDEANYRVVNTRATAEFREQIANELGILVAFLVIMAVLLAAVGVIGLTGTMTINVIESTREIGVMRAIGAQHGSIYQIFITEGLAVGFMAWIIGAAAAYPMSYGLVSLLSGAIGLPLSYRFSWTGVGSWLGIIAAISVLASVAPAFRASQVSVRDAIAYE